MTSGRGGDPPSRECNGGPNSTRWCGQPATLVARGDDGLEWFCCSAHSEGSPTELLAVWFARLEVLAAPAPAAPTAEDLVAVELGCPIDRPSPDTGDGCGPIRLGARWCR